MKMPETVEEFVRATMPSGLRVPMWVLDALAAMPTDFTGRVELHYFRGGLAAVTPLAQGATIKAP